MEIFEDWKIPFREGVVYYVDRGRVRGVLLWNTWETGGSCPERHRRKGAFQILRSQGPAASLLEVLGLCVE